VANPNTSAADSPSLPLAAASRRLREAAKAATEAVERETAGVPPVASEQAEPKRGRRRRPDDWPATFLDVYAKTGSKTKAAKAAGVSVKTVRRHEQEDEAFAEQLADATHAWVEQLESILVEQGRHKNNAIAILALLKRFAPTLYEDKLRIDANVKARHAVAPITHEAAEQLLREMLAEATDTSKAQLARTPLASLPAARGVLEAVPPDVVPIPDAVVVEPSA